MHSKMPIRTEDGPYVTEHVMIHGRTYARTHAKKDVRTQPRTCPSFMAVDAPEHLPDLIPKQVSKHCVRCVSTHVGPRLSGQSVNTIASQGGGRTKEIK